jgi:hypothetical protein
MNTVLLRPELTPLPSRMKTLPVDERGYPVPWFVDWVDGKPEFRAMDGQKWIRAIRERLCWVCGLPLGVYKTFVVGPMCGINRTSAEPPSHSECGFWSAVNCPFLRNPQQARREDGLTDTISAPGFALLRNPGVTLLWTTRTYSLFEDGRGKPLITFGDPEKVDWFAEGRKATRAEILQSIESGMPALMAIAKTEEGAVQELLKTRDQFIAKYLPE